MAIDNFNKSILANIESNSDDIMDIFRKSIGDYLKDYDPTKSYKKGDFIYHDSGDGFKFHRAKADIPPNSITDQTQFAEKFEKIDFKPSIPGMSGMDGYGIGKLDDDEFFKRLKSLLDGYIGDFDTNVDYKKGDVIFRLIDNEYKFLKAKKNINKGRPFDINDWTVLKTHNPLLGGGARDRANGLYIKVFGTKEEAIRTLKEGRGVSLDQIDGTFFPVYIKKCASVSDALNAMKAGPVPLSSLDDTFINPSVAIVDKEGD